MSENDLSKKIRELRALHGLTLEQVAQQVGVGRSTIRKWETGMIENMRRDKIAKLATALHTTPAYLMGWDEPTAPTFTDLLLGASGCWDGSRLREERINQGYSVKDVSSKLRISEEEYCCLESGAYEPTFKLLLRLADIFAYRLDYFCHRTMKLDCVNPDGFSVITPSAQELSADEAGLIRIYRDLNSTGQETAKVLLQGLLSIHPGEEANIAPKEA